MGLFDIKNLYLYSVRRAACLDVEKKHTKWHLSADSLVVGTCLLVVTSCPSWKSTDVCLNRGKKNKKTKKKKNKKKRMSLANQVTIRH